MKTLCKYLSSILLFAFVAEAQQPSTRIPGAKALVVNGQTAPGAVLQINGHTYADLLALSQLTGISINIQPDRIVLTLPGAGAAPADTALQNKQGFSKDFARQAIAHLADDRDWRSAIEMAISVGVQQSPPLGQWLEQHRNRSEESLRLTSVAASTQSDKSAIQLLQNEFAALRDWDSIAATARQALNAAQTMDPSALQNDPQRNKVIQCGQYLNSMLSSGTFSDNAVCH